MGLSIERAVVIALFVETIIYGICLALSAITTIVFVRIRAGGGIADKRLLAALLLMVVTASANVIISFVRVFTAYCVLPNTPDGPARYFANIAEPLFIAKNATLLLQTIWGDSVNIWRCFVIYSRRKAVIAIPLMIMPAGIVTGSFVLSVSSKANESSSVFSDPSRWIKAYDVLMMSTSAYCTAAISWQISRAASRNIFSNNLFPVLVAIIETGVLYTAFLVAFLIAFWAGSNSQYIFIAIVPPLVPCLFCLLILQVKYHKNKSAVHEANSNLHRPAEHAGTAASSSRRGLGFGKGRSGIAVSPFPKVPLMPIQISTQTEICFSPEDASSNHKKGSSVAGEDDSSA